MLLAFTGVTDLTVRGWQQPGRKDVTVERTAGRIAVSVRAPGSFLSFRAAGMSVARKRAFPAAAPEQ
ncbi:hypothetical protein SAMN05428944_2409 [Streptomyces sp. 1222.5]|nr:hypothetical protein BX260_5684 [Streptomyces sp. 5112.2]SEC07024.1 hypothetical protein SAMN05428944_2409 [Streptomyces sp. 1222.5]